MKKLVSRAIIPNKKLFLKVCGLKIDSNYGKGGVADFTSRELDKLSDSIRVVESEYYQTLRQNQMPLDTDTSSSSETQSE